MDGKSKLTRSFDAALILQDKRRAQRARDPETVGRETGALSLILDEGPRRLGTWPMEEKQSSDRGLWPLVSRKVLCWPSGRSVSADAPHNCPLSKPGKYLFLGVWCDCLLGKFRWLFVVLSGNRILYLWCVVNVRSLVLRENVTKYTFINLRNFRPLKIQVFNRDGENNWEDVFECFLFIRCENFIFKLKFLYTNHEPHIRRHPKSRKLKSKTRRKCFFKFDPKTYFALSVF